MTRILVALLAIGLAIAPAAAAKGPHAILTSGPDALEPGKPWEATVELNEFRHPVHPRMIARQGDRTISAEVEKAASSIIGARAFKVTTIFPADGRWKLTLIAGRWRLRFPAADVGSGEAPQDYVAFPVGSEADRAGGGGVYMEPEPAEQVAAGENGVRPPKVFKAYTGSDDDATLRAWWLLPVAGVVLAGAGIATVRRRGSR